tara:strand:- start:463 stop:702 length:240 start_codon:yes stop_codon:yes gene_type:complete
MSTLEKYQHAFIEVLDVNTDQLNDALVYNSVPQWDSIGHMSLIAELEDAYDIVFETDDIIDFSSYIKGKEILQKYGVAV